MSDSLTKTGTIKRASRTSLIKSFFIWNCFLHCSYNYERLQAHGFLHAISPIINDIYDKDDIEGRKKAMQRHIVFFNTQPSIGNTIIGLTAAMEERIASGEKELEETVSSLKYALMGPIAGIGDTLFQGIVGPILLSMVLGLALEGNIIAPFLFAFLYLVINYSVCYYMYTLGYKKGDEAIVRFMESGVINKVIRAAGVMGCLVMGALVANFVRLSTTLKVTFKTGGEFDIQARFFDAIMPKMLPLILTLVIYKLLRNEKMTSIRITLIIIAAGIVLGLLHII
jgi:PTS system mannose-specific IID component